MSRGEKYRTGLMKEKVLARISRAEGWDKADNTMAEDLLGQCNLEAGGRQAEATMALTADDCGDRRLPGCVRVAQVDVSQDAG